MNGQSTLAPANWRETLNPDDRQRLAGEGFLHIRCAADDSALTAMREAWARRLEEPVPAFARRHNNYGPHQLEHEPAFRYCLEHPYVMSAVAELLDGDVILGAFRGRDPRHGSGQQGFHVDSAKPVPADRQCLANAFWMLDDMGESNGATRLIPGSHRLGRIPPKGWQRREARHPDARSIKAQAGDALVFSAHLWHAGSENVSGAPRRIAMAHFARREVIDLYAQAMGADPAQMPGPF